MATWTTAQFGDINEITDGRVPWRPVRHHFGIASFGLNVFTGKEAGDRIINEHDETDDGNEELYFVHSGRARFELDGETLDAPAGTFVYAKPEVKRTAFAEEPNTVLVAIGGVPGKAYETHGWEIWAPLQPLYQAGSTSRSPTASTPISPKSSVADAPLQRCVHLQPHRPQGEGTRAPPPRDGARPRQRPRLRRGRHRPRSDPWRARFKELFG